MNYEETFVPTPSAYNCAQPKGHIALIDLIGTTPISEMIKPRRRYVFIKRLEMVLDSSTLNGDKNTMLQGFLCMI